MSLGPFFDLSGVTQSVVSAIGTSRNLGNDVEWEVEAFVCSRKGILLLEENSCVKERQHEFKSMIWRYRNF